MTRVLFGIFLILSAFVLPWWFSFVLAILGSLYFDNLYEMIVVGLIIDNLYGSFQVFNLSLFFTISLFVIFYFVNKFKKSLFI